MTDLADNSHVPKAGSVCFLGARVRSGIIRCDRACDANCNLEEPEYKHPRVIIRAQMVTLQPTKYLVTFASVALHTQISRFSANTIIQMTHHPPTDHKFLLRERLPCEKEDAELEYFLYSHTYTVELSRLSLNYPIM